MSVTNDRRILQKEYEIYVSMWKDAKTVDGPHSPITRFAKGLVEQVAEELRNLRHPMAA